MESVRLRRKRGTTVKFDPGKAWPHPVLRPPTYGNDYPLAEFEVEIDVKRVMGNSAVEVEAVFELSDRRLLELINEGRAQYVLLVKAPKAHFRDLVESTCQQVNRSYSKGELSGRVEILPFVVCKEDLNAFLSEGWHPDFAGRCFDIPSGAVLAEDVPKDYWIDIDDEAPIGTIFGTKPRSDVPEGRWDYELAEDRVWIVMSEKDAAHYNMVRDRVNNRPEGQYLMNGLYLPALIGILNEVDQSADNHRESRWFDSLDRRLEALDCSPLGTETANRLVDAQKILESPFTKMPLMADLESDTT